MTSEEWEAGTNPRKMLLFVSGRITDRKLRLLAVAFCRRILHMIADEKQRANFEIAELCADGVMPPERLKELYAKADYTSFRMGTRSRLNLAVFAHFR